MTPPNPTDNPIQLDHIIILLSAHDFQNTPSWLTQNFTIIEGGTHSKGTSQNKLIIFSDGTYLELFSWTDPQPEGVAPHADFPSWAEKPEGCIIDWALTGGDASVRYESVMSGLRRLREEGGGGNDVSVEYDEPKGGGRQRKDGKRLEWVTTRPKQSSSSMAVDVPFFCHDVTDRQLRVPSRPGAIPDMPDITTHPCGATGVAGIVIEVAQAKLEKATRVYEAVLGGNHTPAVRKDGASIFSVDVPDAISSPSNGQESQRCSIHLQTPDDDERVPSRGPSGTSIRRLVLFTELDERKGVQIDRDGFSTPINLC